MLTLLKTVFLMIVSSWALDTTELKFIGKEFKLEKSLSTDQLSTTEIQKGNVRVRWIKIESLVFVEMNKTCRGSVLQLTLGHQKVDACWDSENTVQFLTKPHKKIDFFHIQVFQFLQKTNLEQIQHFFNGLHYEIGK